MIAYVEHDTAFKTGGEAKMMPHLVSFLRRMRWVRFDTKLARELPVNGRRVDLAVCTRTKATSAFELKIGGFSRALEQAHYNQHSFSRSWVVVDREPTRANVSEAAKFGIGIIVVSGSDVHVVSRAEFACVRSEVHARIVGKIESMEVTCGAPL